MSEPKPAKKKNYHIKLNLETLVPNFKFQSIVSNVQQEKKMMLYSIVVFIQLASCHLAFGDCKSDLKMTFSRFNADLIGFF